MKRFGRVVSVFSALALVYAGPQINLNIGPFEGATDSDAGINKWLGVPYADPPTRFRAPVAINSTSSDVRQATSFSNACVQSALPHDGQSEDCLYLNIWTPTNLSPDAGLPIVLWVHGGSYQTGSGAADPTELMQRAISNNKPFIFVGTNYRLGPFGFLASASMRPADMNNGLRDQREALRFIKANAGNFGGDGSKITIYGQSAGASGVSLQWLWSDPNEALFRSVIMDSGGPTQYPQADPSAFDLPNGWFTSLANMTGCQRNSLECMRALPVDVFSNATNNLLNTGDPTFTAFPPVLDGDFIKEHNSKFMRAQHFNKAALLVGSNSDEGTVFTLESTNSTNDIHRMLTTVLDPPILEPCVFTSILDLYPNNPSLGSPFDTGNDTFGLNPEYKRAAAVFGDWKYHSAVRFTMRSAQSTQLVWGYNYEIPPPGGDPAQGVAHGSDLNVVMGGVPANAPDGMADAVLKLQDAYINFIVDQDPNGAGGGNDWPQYGTDSNVMQFALNNVTVIPDTYRGDQIDFFMTHFNAFSK